MQKAKHCCANANWRIVGAAEINFYAPDQHVKTSLPRPRGG
jgi:hypothetical protein